MYQPRGRCFVSVHRPIDLDSAINGSKAMLAVLEPHDPRHAMYFLLRRDASYRSIDPSFWSLKGYVYATPDNLCLKMS